VQEISCTVGCCACVVAQPGLDALVSEQEEEEVGGQDTKAPEAVGGTTAVAAKLPAAATAGDQEPVKQQGKARQQQDKDKGQRVEEAEELSGVSWWHAGVCRLCVLDSLPNPHVLVKCEGTGVAHFGQRVHL
jgi:hypothetical protein